jgi:preprotein translocase subunit SecG
MPEIIYTVVRLLQVFLAVGLVAIIVLMQRSEGGLGGLGGGGGGSGGMGGFLTGRAQSNVITRTTAILAAGFLASTLILAYGDHASRGKPTTLVPASTTGPTNTGPETPAPTGTSTGGDSGTTAPSTPAAPVEPAAPAAPTGQ